MLKASSLRSARPVLWGLVLVAAAWLMAMFFAKPQLEADLKERAEIAFGQAGLEWAQAKADGRVIYLSGEAYSVQERILAQRLLRKTWGVGGVVDHTNLAALKQQYIWTASYENNAIKLMGFFPNGAARRSVVQVAREMFPEHEVADQMRPARGAPEDAVWLQAIQFGLAQLSRLQQGGRVNLRGTELAVAGVATSPVAYSSIKGALYRNVPEGVILVKDKVEPPPVSPYTWSAKFDNGQLTLAGHVPSEADRDTLIAAAKAAFQKSPIVDKMIVAAGEPKNWIGAAGIVVQQLAHLEAGEASLEDTKLTISGVAEKQEMVEKVRADLRTGLPSIFQIKQDLKYRQATIPTISPFDTVLSFTGSKLLLTGHMPNRAAADKLVAVAQGALTGLEVSNNLRQANGAPEVWLSCALAALEGLLKLERGRVELIDRNLRLTGLTKSEKIGDEIPRQVRAAANRACTETIELRIEVPPEPILNWRVEHDETTLRIAGEVPDSGVGASLEKLARSLFPKAELIPEFRVKPSQSRKWPKVAAMALQQLAKLRRGTAEIRGQHVMLTGEATDTAVATKIREQLSAGMEKGYSADSDIEVKSAAMLWAEREAQRKAKEAEAAAAMRRAEIDRKKREAAEAARRRQAEEEAARIAQKEAAARKAAEDARLARKREQERQAKEAERLAREKEAKRRAAQARELALRREREQCQKSIDETLRAGTIVFAHGSAELDKASYPTLDRLVKLSGLCGSNSIEISGHTDSSGSKKRNDELSQKRAQSVKDYLIANGMAPDKLIARGYGETQPLVPNSTAANRARNRRIEMKVMVN